MRVHFGISFRLKKLRKFLFPFFIGLLSYFGFSYFNPLVVHAETNYDTYFNILIEEQDFSLDDYGSKNGKEILDLLYGYESDYYNIIVYNNNTSSLIHQIRVELIPKSIDSITNIQFFSQFKKGLTTNFQSKGGYTYIFSVGESDIDSHLESLFNCLDNNICDSNSNYTSVGMSIKNNISYTNNSIDYNVVLFGNYEYQFPYWSNIPLNIGRGSFGKNHLVKSIKINDTIIENGTSLLTYCDLFDCESGSNTDESFDVYLDKLPFVYSNTNDLTNYNSTITFSPTINVEDFVNNLYTYKFYYGRVNHGTYYTYEQLNCTSSSLSNSTDSSVSINTTNVNCTNDLTKYDKYFITYNFKYDDDSLNKSVFGFSSSIRNGFILHNTLINYYLLDNFDNLPRGFSFMLSNNDSLNNLDSYFYSSNPYVGFDYVPKSISNITKTTNGIFYKDLPRPKKCSYGFTTNNNLLVYDDLSYSTDSTTTIYIYLNPKTLLSFVDTSNNQNNYSYYDSNNNITTSSIDLVYDTLDNNTYNLDSVFTNLNNYISDLRHDMLSLHNVMTSIYSSVPDTIRYFFNFFFTLGLVFILYKEMRDS